MHCEPIRLNETSFSKMLVIVRQSTIDRDSKSINTRFQLSQIQRWFVSPKWGRRWFGASRPDAIVFSVSSFDAQWNSLISVHSPFELSGLVPPQEPGASQSDRSRNVSVFVCVFAPRHLSGRDHFPGFLGCNFCDFRHLRLVQR